jgi:hypothetical protein
MPSKEAKTNGAAGIDAEGGRRPTVVPAPATAAPELLDRLGSPDAAGSLEGYEVNFSDAQLKGAPKYTPHETWDWGSRAPAIDDY